MTSPDELLSRKEIAAEFKRDRITVYRWEREGLRLRDGFGTLSEVAWFLELRDCARTLGLETVEILTLDRAGQERHLALALRVRTKADVTSCNIAPGDSAPASR